MKRYIFIYGIVSGAIVIGSTLIGLSVAADSEIFAFSAWLGYLIMLVALSMIFIGIKRYRDVELGGVITFGGAATVGLGIAVVAGIIYVGVWEIYLAATDYAFIEEYPASLIEKARADGTGAPELSAMIDEMAAFKVQYAKPAYRMMITFIEIFPVGFIIALISAAVLRKSSVLPAND